SGPPAVVWTIALTPAFLSAATAQSRPVVVGCHGDAWLPSANTPAAMAPRPAPPRSAGRPPADCRQPLARLRRAAPAANPRRPGPVEARVNGVGMVGQDDGAGPAEDHTSAAVGELVEHLLRLGLEHCFLIRAGLGQELHSGAVRNRGAGQSGDEHPDRR